MNAAKAKKAIALCIAGSFILAIVSFEVCVYPIGIDVVLFINVSLGARSVDLFFTPQVGKQTLIFS